MNQIMNRMKTNGALIRLAIFGIATVGGLHAQGSQGCTNFTILGQYAFTITGQILAPSAVAGPVAGVALTTFDGFGNLTQVDHVTHNGVVPVEAWRPATGTYSVNPDCTGTFTFFPQPTNAADGGPALTVFFVIAQGGAEIRTAVSGSPNTPPFVASLNSIGVRVVTTLTSLGVY
jgi:hypothetical protein